MATPLDPQHPHAARHGLPKRLVLCCDGTWMDSLGIKGEPPSNVTRISRVFRRTCSDGTHQVINYFPGVGTANPIDRFMGGAFGMGLDQDIREVYNFICANYVDGDDIILIGFSRGAFTARSVADLIASIGLLTPEGLDHFPAIFDDYENMANTGRDGDYYVVPRLPEYDGSHGQAKIDWEAARMRKYKRGLRELKYTRDTYHDGVTEIKIKALAVWDTVGTLGIPPAPVIGVRGSADQWTFTNTQISNMVENAFQALALDEPRYAFRPSLWERLPGSATNLKQVWFPGNHGNVGGGWHDQQISDITLAWMCDQLSTLGLEFNYTRLTTLFHETLRFSAAHPFPYAPGGSGNGRSLLPSIPKLPVDSLKRSLSKLLRGSSSKRNPTTSAKPPTTTTTSTTNGPLPWAHPPIFNPPNPYPTTRDSTECTLRVGPSHPLACFSPTHTHTPSSPPHHHNPHHNPLPNPLTLLQHGARPWSLGTIRAPTSTLTTMAGKTVRRPGRVLRVDETTNEDTSEPLVGTCERVHACVRVRLVCGGLGLDEGAVWGCEALTGRGDGVALSNGAGIGKGRGKVGGLWRLERGGALGEREEKAVREGLQRGPREVRLGRRRDGSAAGAGGAGKEYPVDVLYPVGEEDHLWRWAWEGKVEGEGQTRVPQVLALPEEPLVGYWERYLLKLMIGEVDVWKFAQRGLQGY
ncbi:uncharacterized protein B0H64DRAFT_461760 [Chaetomium fimeti]|uniref:T6SS Phospholipase effector Tle1-like catalytic domain-containing protein n=1 Tax=Chaetomium fimeti TaxID=1854472 RepID=A0AAE0HHL5_9PEZI|nr:hypothetical protein B0H64DRAFT_461760 [Chaetomium fimeti]